MLTSTPVTNGRSKWEVIRNSVASAVENWPDLTVVGMLLFPNVATSPSTVELDPEACVAIDSLLPLQLLDVEQQRETLLAALSDTEPVPPAATPLHDAYATAVEALTTIPQYGTDHVMLITDGQPTLSRGCVGPGELGSPVDAQPIIDEIRSAQVDLGVFTWVVGTPGSEADVAAGLDARPWLSAAAEAGGTASPNCSHSGPTYCHLDLSGEADFAAALTETMLPPVCHPSVCSISIPVQPDDQRIDFNEITILVFPANEDQGYILQHGREGECGWYADPDTMRIEICPAACQWLADDCTPHVEILLACSTITPR